ncbi:glycoside hydrolase family 51 protein [Wolfiporia cocos MD-104 SS10]|uniref:non-reducing end alpha-L-arabinofuranosidase n=1 Tax=Wolfiporia cocos (strain MD-104) TaxID=742152 RepID=A0A2H3K1K7_WOLCO|nr:glycoside hydrolase family 51 protein [Wolfiporia cocos MD-104 SS10]
MSLVSLASVLATWILAGVCTPGRRSVTTINVNSTASHSIPTTLYGQIFEDIHSGDGGLYAECVNCAVEPWVSINGANIAVIEETHPVSSALPNSLQFIVPSYATGPIGFSNEGGLGLLEYLTFIEDVGMEPFMAVWSGYSLNKESVPEDELEPYIQQAIDQIEFVVGDANSSEPGDYRLPVSKFITHLLEAALRASLGHPEPFTLNYVEIGNEVVVLHATYTWPAPHTIFGSYEYRWPAFYGSLSAKFPDINFIATTHPFNPVIHPTPKQYDVHVYNPPEWFANHTFYYDSFERNGTRYMEGEYAAFVSYPNDPGNGPPYPTMQSSTGEAAFMTGLERNSDIVFAACYAPLLQNVNISGNVRGHTASLISFDYYVQKLFSVNKGDEYLPSTLPEKYNGTLYWTISRSSSKGDVYIKLVNFAGNASDVTFDLSSFSSVSSTGSLQLLTGSETTSNSPETPNAAIPVTSSITTGSTFNYTAPGYSVSVITLGTNLLSEYGERLFSSD